MPIIDLFKIQDQLSRMEDSYNELNKFSRYASEKSEGREIQDLRGKIVLKIFFFNTLNKKNPYLKV